MGVGEFRNITYQEGCTNEVIITRRPGYSVVHSDGFISRQTGLLGISCSEWHGYFHKQPLNQWHSSLGTGYLLSSFCRGQTLHLPRYRARDRTGTAV